MSRSVILILLSLLFSTITGLGQEPQFTADTEGFQKIARPYFKKHCLECHGPKKEKGDLNLETQLTNNFLDLAETAKWDEILNAVNSHEMPPEDEPQPEANETAVFADWVVKELTRAEVSKKSNRVVLRRLNRAEYVNTIRDLLHIEFDPEFFPEDPPSACFDNIGRALTLSPLHLELYYDAARQIIEQAIISGEQPPMIKWRFEPEESTKGPDRTRVERGKNRILLNMGRNKEVDGFTVIRSTSWDRTVGFRDFKLDHPGGYLIRFRAASRVPTTNDVVKKATELLTARAQEDAHKRQRPLDQKRLDEQIEHFQTDPMYRYGPGRLRIEGKLSGQPAFVHELDIEAPFPKAKTYEFKATFDTSKAGLQFLYAYEIPRVLENHAYQGKDDFPRPEVLLDWIEIEGPIHEQWPPRSHQTLLADLEKPDRTSAKKILTRFMTKAWRRPVNDDEIEKKLKLFDSAIADEIEFIEALKLPLVATLTSPNFLFLSEPGTKPRPLQAPEIAARLSYFLWSSMPDEELTSAKLTSKKEIISQVDRLLAHNKSAAFAENFAGQWLDLRKIGSNPPASDLFPRYDRHLEQSIAAESIGFFSEILHHNLDVRNFIRSDFVTINERLARFYNIPGVKGDHIRKVTTPPGIHRGGIATQASILSVTSNGTRTSPVVRGTWILKNLLDSDPGLPVANAGEISPKVPGIDKATVRQRLEIHRELPQCARCHDKIDPLGFALENYNAAGEWRLREGFGYKGRIGNNDPLIDASAKMPDGTEFTGLSGLQDQLLKKEDLFLRCLAKKLYTYALGREIGHSDKTHLDSAIAHVKKNDYTLRSLIHFIATSEPFLTK
ncbi:DUF1592 domain-containing protein [Akkermansiaceae bacterium]|nr:DUF1592 domain-containing protein [Akkermansiaceae bacterium]